ncbi:hypothetical protein V5O48_005232 [Marasmius crinis-equi]|uniref:Peptidase S33 tripeptidyl aminopeptidase-like C-terminal domain-containing protein n=1 Tax=Marasmius crinis-equi TaxID=585013 RepID=A0ABR3FNT1_9AGAR
MSRENDPKRAFFVVACLLTSACATTNCKDANNLFNRDTDATQAWNDSSWNTIQPSKDLNWVECYPGGFQCSRLQVPLNYSEPEGEFATLALVRLPANVSVDSPDYRGPILFNPGGPGGSGVDQIVGDGPVYHTLFPQFDILGFDPRDRVLGLHRVNELNHSTETVESFWGYSKLMGESAYEQNGDVLGYMNTENVARDMLSIVVAHGREKLQYWGVSYGSVLGSTFAALFPDKVERLIIDGVPDVEDDYYTTQWLTSVTDTDNTLQWFFRSCNEAGPDLCAFYESSVEAIASRFNALEASLINAPIPVRTNFSSGLLDYARLRTTLITTLNRPFFYWPTLAVGLAEAERGNGTTIYSVFDGPTFECDCDPSLHEFEAHAEAQVAYFCNDGDPVPPGLDEARRHYKEITELSSFGSIWASFRISCNGWSSSIPKAQFRGPIAANTSFPLLVIGATADPATPLASARKVAKNFPGSVVLQQDSPGHPSTSAPSICTFRAVQDYFVNGTLPKEGTVCPMDGSPFDPPTTGASGNATIKRDLIDRGDTDHTYSLLQDLARARKAHLISPLRA